MTKDDCKQLDEKLEKILSLLVVEKSRTGTKWIKSAEVKDILNCSDATLKNYRDSGKLRSSKVGGTYYYSLERVNEMFNLLNEKPVNNEK